MNVRGLVLEVDGPRSVETRYGDRDLAEVVVNPTAVSGPNDPPVADDPTTVTLWGDWAETADHLDPGMEMLVTDVATDEYRGETTYATTAESFVVVEPDYLVDVTDVRGWVQCPRIHYLNTLTGVPLNYPVVRGTLVHGVFGDLLRGRDRETAVEERVADAGLELGLLGRDADDVTDEVSRHARAIEGWLAQGTLTEPDTWRSEQWLVSETLGLKGRADAVRRGMPVELKTGTNTTRDPRFPDKVQATCYALLLGAGGPGEHSNDDTAPAAEPDSLDPADTAAVIYTGNAAADRAEETGDLAPAKEFSPGYGLFAFVVRARNEVAAAGVRGTTPTGHEADASCERCFEREPCMAVAGRLGQESKARTVGKPLPEADREYFERFYGLVSDERRAIHRAYARLWNVDAEERAAAGRALVDLEPTGRSQRADGRWELRATRESGAVSRIRAGDYVLASDGDPVDGRAEPARVERLGSEVVVSADEPLDLRRVDVSPSELSADRMLVALHDFLLRGDERRRDVLFGRAEPAFRDGEDDAGTDREASEDSGADLNPAQAAAVERAVAAEDFALVHGPPGTGKTYTIARTVRALAARGERVLLSAFTNRAVDNALEALRDQGFEDVVRVGSESAVRGDMQDLRLEERGDPDERAAALREPAVVAATAATCAKRTMRSLSLDVAVVDEASQLTEPEALAPVNLADRFVLVGDHRQLPPVTRTEGDLSRSLFERLVSDHPGTSVTLDRQYRMAQRIQAFPSREFYDGALRPATGEVAGRSLADLPDVDDSALPEHLRDPVSFVAVDGDDGDHTDDEEAAAVAETVAAFADAGVPLSDVGVIAPFRAQVAAIEARVPDAVTVDTVDRFQGSSEEVVVVSFVATDAVDEPIFEDHRRVNVALTRAKRALVLVGSPGALRSDDLYARMVEWAR